MQNRLRFGHRLLPIVVALVGLLTVGCDWTVYYTVVNQSELDIETSFFAERCDEELGSPQGVMQLAPGTMSRNSGVAVAQPRCVLLRSPDSDFERLEPYVPDAVFVATTSSNGQTTLSIYTEQSTASAIEKSTPIPSFVAWALGAGIAGGLLFAAYWIGRDRGLASAANPRVPRR